MIYMTSCFGANYLIRRVLVGAFLLTIAISLTVIQWKEIRLLNGIHDLHDLRINNEKNLRNNESGSSFLDLNVWTVDQLMEYVQWPEQKACERVGYYGGVLIKSDNVSFFDGHKAICLDKGIGPQVNNCIVYSFGINNEWSFDDTMEEYGCHVG